MSERKSKEDKCGAWISTNGKKDSSNVTWRDMMTDNPCALKDIQGRHGQ
jgi:hypothetical protein